MYIHSIYMRASVRVCVCVCDEKYVEEQEKTYTLYFP